MSTALVDDTFRGLIKKLKRRKHQPWQKSEDHTWSRPFRGDDWGKVSKMVVAALETMKDEGMQRPLGPLQLRAFEASLKTSEPAVHTLALWLTDTRIRVDMLRTSPGDTWIRATLLERGMQLKESA